MNSSRRYALECAALLAAFAAGCGKPDPAKEMASGEAAFGVRDYAKASGHFAKAAELEPSNIDALVMLARSELARGEIPAAAAALAKAAETNGGDADVLQLQAQADYYAKDYDGAAKLFRRIADDASLEASVRSAGWSGLGVVHFLLSDGKGDGPERDALCDRARTEFLRALRLDGKNAAARYHLGRLYRDTFGFPEAAIEQFEFFVHPRLQQEADDRVRRVQREILPQLRDEVARRAAQIPGAANRNKAACAESLKKGEALFVKKRYREAAKLYEAAAKSDPLDARAAKRLAQCLAATAKTDAEQKAANRAYIRACELAPKDIATLNDAAKYAMGVKAYASAAKLYSKALASAGPGVRDCTSVDGLINALKRSGKAKSAAEYQSYRDFISRK